MTNNPYLQQAFAALQDYSPVRGLTKDQPTINQNEGFKTVIQQNNTIIQLLLNLSEQVQQLSQQLITTQASSSKAPAVTTTDIDSLVNKLSKVSLGDKKVAPVKGQVRVFRDPYKVLEEQQKQQQKK